MCYECNQTPIDPPCNCTGYTSPCNCLGYTSPCKYSGADLPCIGIIAGETIDSAITKLADTICNLTPNLPESVLYSERALGTGLITTILSSVSGTSYIVPLGGDGEYEITYVGEYSTPVAGSLSLRLYKGLTEYNAIVRRTVTGAIATVTPFTLFASNISLVAGDEIVIKASATALTYPQNAICKISKIS